MILVCLTNIALLNFVVAILSNTYTKLTNLSSSTYLKTLISLRITNGYNKYFSSMTSAFAGYNVLFLPLMPFVVCARSKRLNKSVLFLQWLPLAFISVLIWVVFEVLLTPFFIVLILFFKLKSIFT